MKNENIYIADRIEEHYIVEVCGIVVEPINIQSPALRNIVCEMAKQDEAELVSCRHEDWSQQAQCGCIAGCLVG